MTVNVQELNRRVRDLRAVLGPLYGEMERVIVGQRPMIDRLLVGLLTGGHLLLEGVPGLAKTLAVRTLARALRLSFSRIQFTPDLLPADVIGTQIYNPRSGDFSIKKGRSSPTSSWPTRSTAPPPRCKAPFWKRCKKNRSPLA